jgi:hypothetical protein
MRVRNAGLFLLAVSTAACGVETPLSETRVAACPVIAPRTPGTYPSISYVSYLLDGEIVIANQRWLHLGGHHSVPVDTVVGPTLFDDLDPRLVESVEVLNAPKSEELGVCPGVRAVSIATKR